MIDAPEITDSHCHLDFPELREDLQGVVARAASAGVTRIVTICTRLRQEPEVRAIAEAHDAVFYAAGTHPMHVAQEPMVTVEEFQDMQSSPKFVGIGETGLDYHYTTENADRQRHSLRIHIAAARACGLPLVVHSRSADDDMARILTEEFRAGAFECVMHCFSSGAELARTALDLGFYLSMSGIVTFPRSDELRRIFSEAPLDQILVETDAPYLAPSPHRGKCNEPAFSAITAREGARIFGLDYSEFARRIQANSKRLFAKAAAWKGTD